MRKFQFVITPIIYVVILMASVLGSANAQVSLDELILSDDIGVEYSRAIFNRRTGQQSFNVSLSNNSPVPIPYPILLTIEEITPADVVVANNDEMTITGIPVFTVNGTGESLAVGGSVTIVVIFDNAGRARLNFSANTYIQPPAGDTTAPVIEITSPVDGAQIDQSPVTVTGTVSDESAVTVAVNGIDATVTNGNYSASVPLVAGSNTLSAIATDAAGNTASTSIQITLLAPPDTTPPVIGITSPVDGAQIDQSPVTVTGTVSDESTVTVVVNGIDATVTNGNYSASVPLVAGSNTLSAIATDAAGNTASTSIQITLLAPPDTTPPVIGITSPVDGAQIDQSPVTVTGTVSDESTVTVAVNGIDATVTNGNYSASVPLQEGLNTLTATATDAAGNTASSSIQLTLQTDQPPVDTAPPTGSIVTPINGGLVTDPRRSIELNFTDPSGVDLDSIVFTVNGNPFDADCSNLNDNGGSCIPTEDYPQGQVTLVISLSDVLGNEGTFQSQFTVDTEVVDITITTPQNGFITKDNEVEISGTIGGDVDTVKVNNVDATISAGAFSALVPLREGTNMVVAVGTKASGKTGTDTVDITRDIQAPVVRINSPSDGFVSAEDKIAVTGLVNDIVNGATNPQVFVNGVEATAMNGAFMALDIPLVRGPNTITVTATDAVGNQGSHSIQVTFQKPVGVRMSVLSGNGQAGLVNQELGESLVVQITDDLGNPVAGRQVMFEVTRNSGALNANGDSVFTRTVQVPTNGSGKAMVRLRMGDTTGEGNNRVSASAIGVAGQVEFCASGLPAPADKILMVMGDNQRGTTNNPLANPYEALVVDVDGNPIANLEVTYTVVSGGGSLNGGSTLVRTTGSDGLARVVLTLGPEPGINNNVVSAAFAGLTGAAATFVASGLAPGNPEETQFRGVVLDSGHTPISGAVVSISGSNSMDTTDDEGQFLLVDVPVGHIELVIDPSNSPRPETFPELLFETITVAGQTNILGQPIILPAINSETKEVGGDQEVTLTMPGVEGLTLTVFPNSAIFPNGSPTGLLSISQVHLDKVPMPPPSGTIFMPPAWTIQPAGTHFDPPARITIPNDGLEPGRVIDIFQFDHTLNQFINVGKGTVSDDARIITSDPGFGITRAGWGGCGQPQPPQTCAGSCDDSNDCTTDNCVSGSCTHTNKPNGTMCDTNNNGTVDGICQNGACLSATEFDPHTPINDKVSIPLVKVDIEASPGEQMTFNLIGEDKDRKRQKGTVAWTDINGSGPYEIKMVVSGNAEFDSSGSGVTTKTFNSLTTGNVHLFVKNSWTGTPKITVTATFEDKASPPASPDFGTTKDPDKVVTWTVKKRGTCPLSMATFQGATNTFRPAPALYGYLMNPDIGSAGRPDYNNQTILETFLNVTANEFTLNDLTNAFKTANPLLNTPDKVATFLWDSGGNGTFVINGSDKIFDQHSGFGTTAPFTAAGLVNGIGYTLPQTYTCGSNTVGSYSIRRRFKNGVTTINKTGP